MKKPKLIKKNYEERGSAFHGGGAIVECVAIFTFYESLLTLR